MAEGGISVRYAFSVCQQQVEEHVFWVAASMVLDGCVGQGESAIDAVRELEVNEGIWIDTAKKYDIPVPETTPVKPEPMTWEAYKEHVKCIDPKAGHALAKIEAAAHFITQSDYHDASSTTAKYNSLRTVDDLLRLVADLREEDESFDIADSCSDNPDYSTDLSDAPPEIKATIIRNDALLRLRDQSKGDYSDD